jgi:hypothetical protein
MGRPNVNTVLHHLKINLAKAVDPLQLLLEIPFGHTRPLSFLFLHANADQMRASNSKRQSSLAQIRFFTLPSLTLT